MIRRLLLALPVILVAAGCEQMAETSAVETGAVETGAAAAAAPAEAPITVTLEEPAPPPTAFTIYFAMDSWLLNDAAETTIDQAVVAAVHHEAKGFTIAGHSDAIGGAGQITRMSKLRAEAVADALVFRGVPGDDMAVSWHGAAQPAVAVPAGAPEQANRRVTIELQ